MNVSSYVFHITGKVSENSLSPVPGVLWRRYLEYLWNYQPNSWVARVAYTCRILAILISFPIVVLALLDISSYLIARTLGVIDDVKASTSDAVTFHQNSDTSIIRINVSAPQSQSDSPFSDSEHEAGSPNEHLFRREATSHPVPDSLFHIGASLPRAFYASEENNLKLSGVGVFSPASSRPPSPTISRKDVFGLSQGSEERLRQRTRYDVASEGATPE